jgi:hypothetical protein
MSPIDVKQTLRTARGNLAIGREAAHRPFVETAKSLLSAFCDNKDLDERIYVRRIGC